MTTIIKRATTGDRGPPEGGVTIHTVEQIGPNMSKLPNGSLLCRNVPLARTGWMMYGPNETPIKTAKGTQVAYVERTAQDLFDDATLASFVGASVVDEHPDDDVTPQNWKRLAKGTVLTARRGEGEDKDLVIGDILVTDAGLIDSIMAGKREVSAGYDADYEQISDGVGRQTKIIVNHIALVERGRCGPRCAIGVQEYQPVVKKGQPIMATKRVQIKGSIRRVTLDTLRKRAADAEQELQAAEEAAAGGAEEGDGTEAEGGSGDTHIHIHTSGEGKKAGPKDKGEAETGDDGEEGGEADPIDARISAIEQAIEKLTASVAALTAGKGAEAQDDDGTEDGAEFEEKDDPFKEKNGETKDDAELEDEADGASNDSASKTHDSAALEAGFKVLLAKAEILVPGFRMPTFDSKAKRKVTVDAMCGLRRKCLDAAYTTRDGASLVNGITGKTSLNLSKMGCKDVAVLFNAAAGAKAAINNASANVGVKTKDSGTQAPTGPKSLAEINAANKAYWDKQLSKA